MLVEEQSQYKRALLEHFEISSAYFQQYFRHQSDLEMFWTGYSTLTPKGLWVYKRIDMGPNTIVKMMKIIKVRLESEMKSFSNIRCL